MIVKYETKNVSCFTPCPHNWKGHEGGGIVKVNSAYCSRCNNYGGNNGDNTITCLKELPLPNIDQLPSIPDFR